MAGVILTQDELCELLRLEEILKPRVAPVICSARTYAKAEALVERMRVSPKDPGKPLRPWNIWRLSRIRNWSSAEKTVLYLLLGREVEIVVRDESNETAIQNKVRDEPTST